MTTETTPPTHPDVIDSVLLELLEVVLGLHERIKVLEAR